MIIESIIREVYDGKPQPRKGAGITGIMVHRVGVDFQSGVVLGYDARSICDAFLGRVPKWAEVAAATGSQNAYTFLIGGDLGPPEFDGRVWQALPLDELGHHGRRFSSPYIGIACIGDFRARVGLPPSSRQLATLAALTADLCAAFDLGASHVAGHGEIRGAHDGSKAPGEPAACPGDLLDMGELRTRVANAVALASRDAALARLSAAGLSLP